MSRSTQADKARHLNLAHRLLKRNMALPAAAQHLARRLGLSLRQAYRYLEEAAELDEPVEVTEATVPVTLKLPPSTLRALRVHSRSSGLTIGVIVTRALDVFLGALRRHG